MKFKSERVKKIFIKVLRIVGWCFALVVGLLVLIALLIQIPAIQQKIKSTAVSFVADKIGTKVSLEHISLSIPKKVVLEGIYLEDQKKDTLLYVGKISVDTDLFALLNKKIELNSIVISDLSTSVSRTSDSIYNFGYIINAFSDSTAAPKDTTQEGWTFSLVDINLNRIRISYDDKVEGNNVRLSLNRLTVNIDEFDLEESRFEVDEFLLGGIDAFITQSKSPAPRTNSPSDENAESVLDFMIHTVDLEDVNIGYSQLALGQEATLNLGKSTLKADHINLTEKKIALDEFALENTFISYHVLVGADTSTVENVEKTKGNDESSWTFSLNDLALKNNSLQYYDFNKTKENVGIDFNHLWVSQFNFTASDLGFSNVGYSGVIEQFSFRERSGFEVKALEANLVVGEKEARLSDFLFQTKATQIKLDASGKFASLKELSTQYPEMEINCTLNDTYLGVADLDFFIPHWADSLPVKKNNLSDIHLNANIYGKVNDLMVEQFLVSTLAATTLSARGKIKGLPEMDETSFNIRLDKFYTTSQDVQSILADTLLPETIALPSWVELSGDFSGTKTTPVVKSELRSEYGSVLVEASLNTQTLPEKYQGTFSINDFNVGKLLKQPESIGSLDLDATLNGSGFDPETLQATVDVKMNSFGFKDYVYKDFVVEGNLKNYLFTGKASMNDPNLIFDFDGNFDYDFTKAERAYHFDFNLKNADLNALHLAERPLKVRLALTIDLDNADPRDLNGNLSLHNIAIYNGETLYKVDSLLFASIHDDEQTELSISSDLINAKFTGSFDLLELPEVMKDYFNTYYQFQDTLHYPAEKLQQFSFDIQFKSTRLLTEVLIPDLKRFVPGEMKGEFNNLEKKLEIAIEIDEIEYGNIKGDGLKFEVNADPKRLNYKFQTGELSFSVVDIPALDFNGEVSDNSINTNLVIYDSLKEERYVLGGVFTSIEDAFKFHLLPDKLVLDYEDWSVPQENFVTMTKSGMSTSDFRLENEAQKIIVEANRDQKSMQIRLDQLQLSTLARIAFSNDTLIHGIINGNIDFKKVEESTLLGADITIHDVALSKSTLGDIHIVAKQPNVNEYDFDFDVKGPATQIDINGNLLNKDSVQQTNINANISSLDLAAIEPLLFGQVTKLKGNLMGNAKVSGNTSKPEIDGDITFQNTSLIPTYIGVPLKMERETISFTHNEIVLRNFSIKDEKDNPLTINGRVRLENDMNHSLDLTTKANNFLLMNSKEGSNDSFFGKLIVNADAKVKGTTSHPDVYVQLSLGDDSNFTYIVPQEDKGVMEREGVVKFVDRDVHKDPFLAAVEKEAKIREDAVSVVQGITLTAKIEIDDTETLNILIDPVTGDKLTVQGNSTLTLDIDPTGDMNLTGRYELTSGSYSLTFYKLVKREFEIQKGSTITWSGDPLNADLDITGLYRVETSPVELLQTQTSSTDSDQLRQRLPFIVKLNVDGKILTPLISFSIDMPEQQRNALGGSVYARLQDINSRESDLNKQVFALLILKRFIADNPFESEGGASLESAARTSVSRFLTDQLNQMSDNIKGVELTFDLKSYEDYSGDETANRTQLQVGLSKNLFSDRLIVRLAGNVDLEGQQGPQDFSNYIGDLALEYKLTEDGRLRVTGFYNSDYDMIDGELKDAGVGLIYVKDYDTLRELFKANDKGSK